jgi:hypothetical protein
VGSSYFLGVFLGLFFLLILLDYVFIMDFVYMHSSPWWYLCGLSAVVLFELFLVRKGTKMSWFHRRQKHCRLFFSVNRFHMLL